MRPMGWDRYVYGHCLLFGLYHVFTRVQNTPQRVQIISGASVIHMFYACATFVTFHKTRVGLITLSS